MAGSLLQRRVTAFGLGACVGEVSHYTGLGRNCGRRAGVFGRLGSIRQCYSPESREAGGAVAIDFLEFLVEEIIDTGE